MVRHLGEAIAAGERAEDLGRADCLSGSPPRCSADRLHQRLDQPLQGYTLVPSSYPGPRSQPDGGLAIYRTGRLSLSLPVMGSVVLRR